ncbi:MAG: phospholipase [Methanomicrobiales archaeon]|nr:phospholipase [Methanomicrobiales archaeon]
MYRPFLTFVLCAFCVVSASAGISILEVYPDTWIKGDEDEYVTIGWGSVPAQCELSDGEGTISFVPADNAVKRCTVAHNGESYKQVWGHYPDFEIIDATPAVSQVSLLGKFQLANKKDELTLTSQGVIHDSVSWPGTFKPRKGQIHVCSSDGRWDERVLMAGGSRIVPQTFHNISGVAFVSPDCSRKVLEESIHHANETILLNIYEFTDPGLAKLLCDAQHRGVSVTVLLEGGPVGGIPPEEFPIIHDLIQAGADVRIMEGDGEDHAPYRYDHAKYLVIDSSRIFVTTENFKEHSFPHAGYAGNRGWGVLLTSPDLAEYFAQVFHDDSDGPGVNTAEGRPGPTDKPVVDPYSPIFTPQEFSDAQITPVFSPDTSILIADMVNQSNRRVWIEQAYITDYPGNETNPFLTAAIQAARRGVDVRILLDGYYYNVEDENDNDEMVTSLQTLAARENLSLQAKILYPERTGLLKVHTKGVIADDHVLVSSMNWNENSACFNREAGVIIQSTEAASYFASVFLIDWSGKRASGQAGDSSSAMNNTGVIQMMALVGVMIFLIILYRRHHR